MKSFTEFLTESTKQYDFRIKVAGTLSDDQVDRLEAAMERWGLQNLNKPKVTPIQKHPTDFTNLKEIEVSIIDITLDYPVTPQEIIARISEYCTVNPEYIKVFNSDDPNQLEVEEKEEEYQVQLTSPYPKSEKNLPAGDKFTQKFLKDQKRKPSFKIAGGSTTKSSSTNDLSQGNISPISGQSKSKLSK